MLPGIVTPTIPLPRSWHPHAKSAVVHAVALARVALAYVRSGFENSPLERARLVAKAFALETELRLVCEELAIKDARMMSIPAARRPQYSPSERLRILTLRAARGWNARETARRMLVTATTIATWTKRVDQQGPDALVQTRVPVRKFPDFVAVLVKNLRAMFPAMGKVRIAQVLGRAGLHLAPATVERMTQRPHPLPSPSPEPITPVADKREPGRTVTAKYPHHVWNVDLTVVPTFSAFWLPWFPFSLPQSWPFAWWIGGVLDHFSRSVVAARVFFHEPTADEICSLLDDAVRTAGTAPKYTITDRGSQFRDAYRAWCGAHAVRPRFGAVGKSGSIAVLERFWRSMKSEAFRRILVPLSLRTMQHELDLYCRWYNVVRPHQSFRGATPAEILAARAPAICEVGFDVLYRDPAHERGPPELQLVVSQVDGRAHLPVIELRRVA